MASVVHGINGNLSMQASIENSFQERTSDLIVNFEDRIVGEGPTRDELIAKGNEMIKTKIKDTEKKATLALYKLSRTLVP